MRAVFLGTPAVAIPSLAALIDVAHIPIVVTRPDRPKGRSRTPTPPPVKLAAKEWGLAVAQPTGREEVEDVLRRADADIGVVVAYGSILTPTALATTPAGFINVHFSLLPRWRGAAPVERAILAGDEKTGVSLMQLDEGLDTGPVIAAIETPIASDETGGSLSGRLAYLGAMMIDDVLPDLLVGRLEAASQLRAGVTDATPLTSADGRIESSWTVEFAERAVRAFNPRPGAWFEMGGTRYQVQSASLSEESATPGSIVAFGKHPVIGFQGGSLTIDVIQPAGKAQMSGTAWLNGRRGLGGRIDPTVE